jgi:DNA-binding NarL/FixJ family response regulator
MRSWESAPMETVRVLVAGRHSLFAGVLGTRLTTEPGFSVVAVTSRAQSTTAARALRPDIVILDVTDSGEVTYDLTVSLREAVPEMRIVVLGDDDDVRTVCASISGGASAYVTRGQTTDSLVEVMRGVMRDETFVPPQLLTGLLKRLQERARGRGEQSRKLDVLTARERTILELMVAGLDREAIGRTLGLSLNTIRTHAQNCYAKLGVHSGLEAVHVAHRAGLRPTVLPAVSEAL